uniref:Ankyrin repeat-containing protein n=1 Tax=Rhizophora mucronata TaxID=61149 RepID=A0A2P2JXH8_RHIMU
MSKHPSFHLIHQNKPIPNKNLLTSNQQKFYLKEPSLPIIISLDSLKNPNRKTKIKYLPQL